MRGIFMCDYIKCDDSKRRLISYGVIEGVLQERHCKIG